MTSTDRTAAEVYAAALNRQADAEDAAARTEADVRDDLATARRDLEAAREAVRALAALGPAVELHGTDDRLADELEARRSTVLDLEAELRAILAPGTARSTATPDRRTVDTVILLVPHTEDENRLGVLYAGVHVGDVELHLFDETDTVAWLALNLEGREVARYAAPAPTVGRDDAVRAVLAHAVRAAYGA